jgi:hypothetical protein
MNNATMRWTFACMIGALLMSGCATYRTPGAGLSIGDLSRMDADITELMQREPAAQFPASLATARVQASGYYSRNNDCYGKGRYCVVTARDIETAQDMQRLMRMPEISAVAPLSRLLFPAQLDSIRDIRIAASNLKADIVLVYSVDTHFSVESTDIGPLALISLGFLPNKKAHVTTTASAALFDVRSGFVYGVAEATAAEQQRATVWSTQQSIDNSRLKTEAEAFHRLLGEIESLWSGIAQQGVAQSIRR